jgi:hypothetical protein
MKKFLIALLALAVLSLPLLARENRATLTTTLEKNGTRKTEYNLKTEKSSIKASYVKSSKNKSTDASYQKSDDSGHQVKIKAHQQKQVSYGYYYEHNEDGGSMLVGYVNPKAAGKSDSFMLMKNRDGNSYWLHQIGDDPDIESIFDSTSPQLNDSTSNSLSLHGIDQPELENRIHDLISEKVRSITLDIMR